MEARPDQLSEEGLVGGRAPPRRLGPAPVPFPPTLMLLEVADLAGGDHDQHLPQVVAVLQAREAALFRPAARNAKLAFLGGLACVMVLQGFSNAVVNDQWGYSFIHRLGAMLHPQRMAVESDGFPSAPPWHYILTLLAAFIPPASILLLAAAVKGGGARQLSLLGIPTLAFFVSHSVIANKQERFLLPILPILFIRALSASSACNRFVFVHPIADAPGSPTTPVTRFTSIVA